MSESDLCDVPSIESIMARLPLVFPEGVEHRPYLIREICAKTMFVMFYTGAVEGTDRWIRPNQVVRMTDAQSLATSEQDRRTWTQASLQPGTGNISGRWFADNTREPIRDETIRFGLCPVGAVLERQGLATTSSLPRYALARDFARLFLCAEEDLAAAVRDWQDAHLSPEARARLAILRHGAVAVAQDRDIHVTFPNGETRRMTPGPSSVLSKAVIEEFSGRFLENPGVISLSESRNKVVARDHKLSEAIGLAIPAAEVLPDIILVDLGPREPMLVFVEVVATDGPINEKRKLDLTALAENAGFGQRNLAFLTAFMDKTGAVFRRLSTDIAWGTFVWFASDPGGILYYRRDDGARVPLSRLLADKA